MFEAIEIGPFIIWTRLVFVLLGIWLSTEFFLRLAQSAHLSLQHFQEHAWQYVVAFLAGGRLLAMVAEYQVYKKDPLQIFIFWDGGFSYLGGAIGVAALLYIVTRSQRSTFLQWLDALLPATMLGLVFSWIGAFAAGHSYGRPTDSFLGVTYDAMNVRYAVPIHPVQLYYAVFYFSLTFLLLIIRKRSKRVGAETLFGILVAATGTFIFEYFRGDPGRPVFATKLDFIVLLMLFISLGIFAIIELKLSNRTIIIAETILGVVYGGSLIARPFLPFETFELRYTQFLAILVALATVVYVVVHRRKYPHL